MISKINNASVVIDGITYHDITVLYHTYRETKDLALCVTDSVYQSIVKKCNERNAIAPKGASIYLMNDIPVDINVLRRSYSIKRKMEDADYIVYGPCKKYSSTLWLHDCKFYKDKNLIVSYHSFEPDEVSHIKDEYGLENPYCNPDKVIKYMVLRCLADTKGNALKFLKGELTKPVVNYKDLDVSFGKDIILDVLELTYKLGVDTTSKSSDNLLINLKALNNYNWQKYKFTLSMIFHILKNTSFSSYNELTHYRSQLPKSVTQILDECLETRNIVSEDDMLLAQEFLIKLLDIKQLPIFVSTNALLNKLYSNNVDLTTFEKLFGVVARINRKEYVQEENKD